jgi:hypothetical protein
VRPAEITRYIALVVEEELSEDLMKSWFRCVKERAPYSVMTTVEVSDNSGTSSAAMVKRGTDKGIFYIIPLTRDLLEAEATRIIAGFSAEHGDVDFDVEATVVRTGDNGTAPPKINVEQERYLELCTSLSKKQHEDWVKTRTDDGWRYGTQVSIAAKTHPLLRPWEDLPDRFRTIDMDQPQRLIDLLGQHGYTVVSKEDLESVFRLVRSIR